jgi:hypothetical protein
MATAVSEMSPDCEHECDICTMSSIKFITFECMHSCCRGCFSKIDKCHMSRASIKRIKPTMVCLSFPGNINAPFYFDACDYMINERLMNMSRKMMLRLIPNLWKYDFEAICINDSEEYGDVLMELLTDERYNSDQDYYYDVSDDYADDVVHTYGYDDEFNYNLDVDMEIKLIHLLNYIRYKLIKHSDDPIRDNWIGREYRWRRSMLGSRRADEFLRGYVQIGQVLFDGIALD